MNKTVVFFLSFWWSALLSFGQTVQEGLRAMEVDKFNKARKIFSALYKNAPNAENAYYLGNFYYTIEKPDSAEIYFKEGLAKDASNPWNHIGMGKVIYARNVPEGKASFGKAIELTKSRNANVLAAIAAFYVANDKLQVPEAFNLLATAAKLSPKDPEIPVIRGDGYLKILDPTKAVLSYEEALKLDPKYGPALVRLGDSYQRVFNYDRAAEYYNKALASDSLYAPAYRGLGDAAYRKQDYEKAFSYYKKYVSIADEDENTAVRYASFLVVARDFKKALTVLQPYEHSNKGIPSMYRLLGYSYYETGNTDKAMEYMDRFWKEVDRRKIMPTDYEYYGKIYAKKGNDSLAAENLEKALQMDSLRADLYGELGEVYMGQKKYSKAEAVLERKVKMRPATKDLYNLGRVYYYDKKYDKADTTFGALLALVPSYPQGYLWKAKARTNLDPTSEKGLARPYYEKFIELASGDAEKNRKELINAYEYLGYYYILKKDKEKAKAAYTKMKALDPSNKKAEDGLKIVGSMK